MEISSFLIRRFRFGYWPTVLRKPITKLFLKRKLLNSCVFQCRLHGFEYVGDAANLIDYHILAYGSFEPGLTALLQRWAKKSGGGVLLDVGANVGVHSLGGCKAFEHVIAVEPFLTIVARLKGCIRLNKVQNIMVIEGALADENGSMFFKPPAKGNLGTGRLISKEEQSSGANACIVPVYRGDALIEQHHVRLTAVKIDVEGFEFKVLEGLQGSIRKDRPLIACEVLSCPSKRVDQFKALFPQNYAFYKIKNINKTSAELLPWVSEAGDLVACPIEKTTWLKN